jgi:predicted secreted protein
MTPLTRATVPAELQMHVGETLDVILDAQTGGGYVWLISAEPGGHVDVTTSYLPGPGIGSPSRQTVCLIARAAGHERLCCEYRRPWEDDSLDRFVVDVHVDSGPAESVT